MLAHPSADIPPSITAIFRTLVARLAEQEVADPLYNRAPLALVWADLCDLAGEPVPDDILEAVDAAFDRLAA